MNRRFPLIAGLVLVALSTSGCGYKGNLEYPPEAKAEAAAGTTAPSTDPNAPKPPVTKPFKPFVLDGLIQ